MSVKPVVFIGAERAGKAVLKKLLEAGKNIVAVFTAGTILKNNIADYVDFRDLEKSYPGVDFHYITNSADTATVETIKKYRPEAIFVVSWSQIIPVRILEISPKGVIGLHYSLLPKRRGGAPLNWAIIDGLKETGITLYYMDKGIDTGDIIAQRRFFIECDDTVNDLLVKIREIAPAFILEYFDAIIKQKAVRIRQDDSRATYTPRRTPKDSEIDWSWDLEKIYNFIRALAPPYPPAFYKSCNKKIMCTSAKKLKNKRVEIRGYIAEDPQGALIKGEHTDV